jgi:methanethiol S-methyltransferase
MLSRWIKAVDVSAIALAVLCGVGSVVFFVVRPLGAFSLLHVHWSDPRILLWNTLLSLAFFVQHSGMNRQGFRTWLSRSVAPRYHGAIYSIASGVALILLVTLWQTSDTNVLVLRGFARSLAHIVSLLAFGLFIWSTMALMTFDPLGLRPIAAHLRGRSHTPSPLMVRGAYRWVRHPLYSCVIVMIWTEPDITLDRLVFNLVWTAWIVLGTYLEERDLRREFGNTYREYQQRVPMLVPWPGRSVARWVPAQAGE